VTGYARGVMSRDTDKVRPVFLRPILAGGKKEAEAVKAASDGRSLKTSPFPSPLPPPKTLIINSLCVWCTAIQDHVINDSYLALCKSVVL
jgi:hypothetical protein